MIVIEVFWFSGDTTVGIIFCENDEGVKKAYVGRVSGFNEETDIQYLMDWGTRIHKCQVDKIIKCLNMIDED